MSLKFLISLSILASSVALAFRFRGTTPNKIIYGQDNRKNIEEPEGRTWASESASVALIASTKEILYEGADIRLRTEIFSETRNLCKDEPFANEPLAGRCTGFLVGADLLATAGHCFAGLDVNKICKETAVVFGHKLSKNLKTLDPLSPIDQLFYCKEVLEVKKDLQTNTDFALIRLDRPATTKNRRVLSLEMNSEINNELVVIGHPIGLPMKIADGGKVIKKVSDRMILASLDTYGGSSGSPVFEKSTHKVVGILVSGGRDFVTTEAQCDASIRCSEGKCPGEGVFLTSSLRGYVSAFPEEEKQRSPQIVVQTEFDKGVRIPDFETGTLEVPINIASEGELADLALGLTFSHPVNQELKVELVSPNGTTSMIREPKQKGPQSPEVRSESYGFGKLAPSLGVAPELEKVRGQNIKGTWILKFSDISPGDEGEIYNARLSIATYAK